MSNGFRFLLFYNSQNLNIYVSILLKSIIFIKQIMFKALTTGALIVASFAMRMDVEAAHDQTWAPATNLNENQRAWENFFRDQIKAIGDSETKQVATNPDGSVSLQFLDTTNDDNVVVAWDVTGNNDSENRRVEKVVQVKTIPNKDDPNVSTITKTTFLRDNLINVNKQLFAWMIVHQYSSISSYKKYTKKYTSTKL